MTSTFWVKAALNNLVQSPFLKSVKYNWCIKGVDHPTSALNRPKQTLPWHLFYNKWVISCVLIGQELWLIRTSIDFGNGMMVAQFVFIFLSHVTFWWETSAEINFKNIQHYVKKDQQKNLSLSVLLSIIEMTSKCSKLCSEATCLYGSWLHLTFDYSDVIPWWSIRVQTMETCFQFVFVKIIKN